jgi:N-acetylmuramoyl-L-alanine amidase
VSPGSSHRFSAEVPAHAIQLRLQSGGRAHPEEGYTALVDGRSITGTIGSDGMVTIPVRPTTRVVVLTIHERWDDFEHDHVMHLRVGGLDPATSTTGVQARLSHLCFQPGRVDGELGPRTRDAVRRFQAAHGLELTGEVDDATRDRLVQEHGH